MMAAVAPADGRFPLVIAGRITTGAGSGVRSGRFSHSVADYAVTNRTSRATTLVKTRSPRIGPNATPAGEVVTAVR